MSGDRKLPPKTFFAELERLMPQFSQDMLASQKIPGDCSVLVFREWAKERAAQEPVRIGEYTGTEE